MMSPLAEGGFMKGWWLVCLVLAAGCGSGAGVGSPTPIPSSLTSITVTGTDLLLVGASEMFTAAGNTGALTRPLWGSDAPTVATVDAGTGQVTAVGTGTATIFVDANGIRGTKLIRTLPNFGGSWHGWYEETDCQASGDYALLGLCSDLSIGEMRMTLTQNRDSISGVFALLDDGKASDVSGSVSPEGTLTFTGTQEQFNFNLQLQNVRFELPRKGQMTGTFEQVYSSRTTSLSGTWRVFSRLRDMYGGN
jgi:hypothetical protein